MPSAPGFPGKRGFKNGDWGWESPGSTGCQAHPPGVWKPDSGKQLDPMTGTAPTLETLLRRFADASSRWPEGLLSGEAFADLDQSGRLKADLRRARDLDPEGRHREALDGFETRLRIHIGQLKSDTGRCFL